MSVKRILVSPLSWGLGHASRCVPIIQALTLQGVEPILASEGMALAFLRKEFPALEWIDMKCDPEINYPKGDPSTYRMMVKLARQFPKMNRTIRKEHTVIQEITAKMGIDAILSDNRFGVFSHKLPSVFISHQLSPIAPPISKFVGMMNHKRIQPFTQIWVPDLPGSILSGKLSANWRGMNAPKYIGVLSRMRKCDAVREEGSVLFILSGPEPQRTHLEEIVKEFMESAHASRFLKITLVRGKPGCTSSLSIDKDHVMVHNHLSSEVLNELLCSSQLVVSRSGYSSVMDYVRTGTNALLIPTPGQSEQLYLAKHLNKVSDQFLCVHQSELQLSEHLETLKSKLTATMQFECTNSLLEETIHSFLGEIS